MLLIGCKYYFIFLKLYINNFISNNIYHIKFISNQNKVYHQYVKIKRIKLVSTKYNFNKYICTCQTLVMKMNIHLKTKNL
jgi:hypothetical protein